MLWYSSNKSILHCTLHKMMLCLLPADPDVLVRLVKAIPCWSILRSRCFKAFAYQQGFSHNERLNFKAFCFFSFLLIFFLLRSSPKYILACKVSSSFFFLFAFLIEMYSLLLLHFFFFFYCMLLNINFTMKIIKNASLAISTSINTT